MMLSEQTLRFEYIDLKRFTEVKDDFIFYMLKIMSTGPEARHI